MVGVAGVVPAGTIWGWRQECKKVAHERPLTWFAKGFMVEYGVGEK